MSTLDTSGRVLTGWNPEEPENWSAKIAWTTLIVSTYSMILRKRRVPELIPV